MDEPPRVVEWMTGLGGMDPTPEAIERAVLDAMEGRERIWMKV